MAKIVIVDYGVGNIYNLTNAVKKIGCTPVLTDDPEEILAADLAILPGVGAFRPAMEALASKGLIPVLRKRHEEKKALMGICLGMQLFYASSEEDGPVEGLGFLTGSLRRFTDPKLKVPHMGWNELEPGPAGALLEDRLFDYVYFVHSYYLDGGDPETFVATADYGVTVPALVVSGHLTGLQFHPEKSGEVGLAILKSCIERGGSVCSE
jgi:glutamine amidotransferase